MSVTSQPQSADEEDTSLVDHETCNEATNTETETATSFDLLSIASTEDANESVVPSRDGTPQTAAQQQHIIPSMHSLVNLPVPVDPKNPNMYLQTPCFSHVSLSCTLSGTLTVMAIDSGVSSMLCVVNNPSSQGRYYAEHCELLGFSRLADCSDHVVSPDGRRVAVASQFGI